MEAKSLHYSGLLTTLQLRLAEGCWRNGFHDRFAQSGIFSNLENFYSRHGSIDTIKIWRKHLHVQLPSSASNVPRKVSTGFAFPLNWSRIWQEISELIIAGVRNIHTWKEGYQKSLKVTVFTQLEKRSNKILQQMLLYWCLLLNGSEKLFCGRFPFAYARNFCRAWSSPRPPISILICSFA